MYDDDFFMYCIKGSDNKRGMHYTKRIRTTSKSRERMRTTADSAGRMRHARRSCRDRSPSRT